MNILAHNLTAMNAQRMLGLNINDQKKSSEKLSSGYKINRAADDAAGLSISEKMRKQIRGLTQASQNAQDGISMVQTADGALEEVHAMLQRGNELAIKAANGTLSASDRSDINQEIQQLKEAIDQVAANTKFNETYLFPSHGLHPAQAGVITSNSYELEFDPSGTVSVIHTDSSEGTGSLSAVSTGNALSDKIANEYVPNAVQQILDKFTPLKNEIGKYTGSDADKLKMALDIKYIDGPSGTLAYVQGNFHTSSQKLSSLTMAVDSADFSADDVKNNNTAKLGKLESTIAHEMMHAVMDAATPSRMYRSDNGIEDYPKWFVEGTAQLVGGGFTTGWNDYLMRAVKNGADDNEIKSLLKQYTVEDRVYGHGYLAAAYMGYLASNSNDVTAENIVKGMNDVFKRLIGYPAESLKDAVNKVLENAGSSKTYDDIINDINNGTDAGVDFVRKLVTASMDGAGSVIASGGLGAKATEVLGDGEGSSVISIDPAKITTDEETEFGPRANLLSIQAGADNLESNRITMKLFRMSSSDLGLSEVGNTNKDMETDALSMEGARSAIDSFANAIKLVSGVRSYYGAVQNRMEHTIKNLDNVIENTTSSESLLRDTDMASEMVKYSRTNILQQAGQSMLAQANQSNQGTLSLLQ